MNSFAQLAESLHKSLSSKMLQRFVEYEQTAVWPRLKRSMTELLVAEKQMAKVSNPWEVQLPGISLDKFEGMPFIPDVAGSSQLS